MELSVNPPQKQSFGSIKVKNIKLNQPEEARLAQDLMSMRSIKNIFEGENIEESFCQMPDNFLNSQFNAARTQIGANDCVVSSYYNTPYLVAHPKLEEEIAGNLQKKGYDLDILG